MQHMIELIGRFDQTSGIGAHGWSFLKTLGRDPRFQIHVCLTDRSISKASLQPFVEPEKVRFLDEPPRASPLFSVFCDVLANHPGDDRWTAAMAGAIKIAYVVFDSTRLPPEWAGILNDHFDLCLTPSAFVKQAALDSGVTIDTAVLPLCVEKPDLGDPRPSGAEPFTFGFLGSYEQRKNVPLLVEAFNRAFPQSDVRLRIHLTYSHYTEKELFQFATNKQSDRISITFGPLARDQWLDIARRDDCFVSLSMGEGYSIIPREFMLAGVPVLVSDSSAHRELPGVDGVFFVPAEIPYPAHYPQIDGKFHGVQYSPYVDDAVFALQSVEREIRNGARRYLAMMEAAAAWLPEKLAPLYASLFAPDRLEHVASAAAKIGVSLQVSPRLAQKYPASIHASEPQPFKHVVRANDGGFFSVFNRFVSILVWERGLTGDTLVIPDWRISSMIRHYGHDRFTSFCYGSPADGNIYLKLFEPLPYEQVRVEQYDDDDWLTAGSVYRDDYNEKLEPNLTYIHAYKLYRDADFPAWRERYHSVVAKYVKLQPRIADEIDAVAREYLDGHFVIGAHVRHPSHAIEQPGGRVPTVDLFKEHIDQQIRIAEASQPKPVRIFLATDQSSVVEYFRGCYGDRLVWIDATRTTAEQEKYFESLPDEEKMTEGFQIQHIMAADKSKNSIRMAEDVIKDTWLLARCDVFVHITSNIATAVAFLNPRSKMVYCE